MVKKNYKTYDYIKIKNYSETTLDIEEEDVWLLNFSNERYLKVNTLTKTIFSKFNGEKTIDEIISDLRNDNINISVEELVEFIDCYLKKNNLVEGMSKKKELKITFTFYFPLISASKLNYLFDVLKLLYKRKIVLILMVLCFVIQGTALFGGDANLYIQYKNNSGNALSIVVLFLIGTIFHEFGHATAARYYNVPIGKMGLGVYLFMPVAFTDLTNIWQIDRWKRIVVNLGGLYFSLIYTSIIWIIGTLCNNVNFLILNIIIIITMLMNLNPLLRMDGYWVVNDFLGIVNINKKMYEIVVYGINRLRGIQGEFPLKKSKNMIYYIYFIAYMICNGIFFVLGFVNLVKMIV